MLLLMVVFSVSSFFLAIAESSSSSRHMRSLWHLKAPLRVLPFGWIAILCKLLTQDNLHRRGLIIFNVCHLCLEDGESVDHLFLRCKTSRCIWNSVLSWFSCEWVLPCSLPLLFEALKLAIGSTRGRVMWKASFMATIWSIWREWNARCLKARCLRLKSVDKVKFLVSSRVLCFSQFRDFRISLIQRNWHEMTFSSPCYPQSVLRWWLLLCGFANLL